MVVGAQQADATAQHADVTAVSALPAATLSVNTANETGKRLYESVGMRVAWRAERWTTPLTLSGSARR